MQGEGEEGSERECTHLMEEKYGQHWKHPGQISVILAQNSHASTNGGSSAADGVSFVFYFLGFWPAKGWAPIA